MQAAHLGASGSATPGAPWQQQHHHHQHQQHQQQQPPTLPVSFAASSALRQAPGPDAAGSASFGSWAANGQRAPGGSFGNWLQPSQQAPRSPRGHEHGPGCGHEHWHGGGERDPLLLPSAPSARTHYEAVAPSKWRPGDDLDGGRPGAGARLPACCLSASPCTCTRPARRVCAHARAHKRRWQGPPGAALIPPARAPAGETYTELYRRAYCSQADVVFMPLWFATMAALAIAGQLSFWALLVAGVTTFFCGIYLVVVRWVPCWLAAWASLGRGP
jgi:hypothetical protein